MFRTGSRVHKVLTAVASGYDTSHKIRACLGLPLSEISSYLRRLEKYGLTEKFDSVQYPVSNQDGHCWRLNNRGRDALINQ